MRGLWTAAAPAVFVLLWSTGFIGARLGLPHAEPFIFLFIRFAILAALLTGVGLLWRAPWPKNWRQAGHLAVIGVFIHAGFQGGVFMSIAVGVPAAVTALIVSMQPLLTAVAAGPYLGEKVGPRQWSGLVIGFIGVALVVGDDLTLEGGYADGVLFSLIGLIGITFGTLYQKRHGGDMDLRTGSAIQFIAAGAVALILTLTFEQGRVVWTGDFIFALSWLVVVLSIGAISLLYLLIRRGAASRVASLFYLVPPVVAVEAYLLFGETLSLWDGAGMLVATAAVALVLHGGDGKTQS